jgi:SAM-dependent MidA family methyltransferase
LKDWRASWHRGRMLTIDYGGPIETLYDRRPRGTLRGYFRQQRVDGAEIYERAGHQDLTADVNFANLIGWGESLGLTAAPLLSQREFILQWNPRVNHADAATAHLLEPLGAGHAFKILEQVART